jgi:conjugal transfer ATP-binding protein TraC
VAKHQGALGIGIQALSDLYKNEKTRTISAQTAHFLVMRQNADSVAQLENNNQFVIGPSGLAMMKTVRKTREYAETFLYSEESMAIGRLKLDPYRRVLFATDGPEKEEVVEAMRNGVDPDTAIRQFLAQHPEFSTGEYSGEDLDSEDAEEAEKGGKEVEYLGDIAGVAEDREDTEGAA